MDINADIQIGSVSDAQDKCKKLRDAYLKYEPMLRKVTGLFFVPGKWKTAINNLLDEIDGFITSLEVKSRV